jgi:serine/threonine-protein kinase
MSSGQTILNNRYLLTAQQASGGMAVVYKAIDQSLGRTVAIKVLRPSLTADPSFITRFQNEARSIANLAHPNIVTVHDVGTDGSAHYMVMEFVEGQDLKKLIRMSGSLDIARAVKIAIQICAGLGFAHRAGIVHADVKPQNVLLTKDQIVKITDFGIAQAWSDTQPVQQKQSVVWGSPHYFAPEQAQGEKPTAASDVYSIGIVLFEMLTGKLPFIGTNQQELALEHIRGRIPLLNEINPAIPQDLVNIVFKVMSKEPSARYRTADQLGRVLIAFQERGHDRTATNVPGVEMPLNPHEQSQPSTPPLQPAPEQPVHRPQTQTPPPPPMRQKALPTQQYNPAPNAPNPVDYRQRSIPSPQRQSSGNASQSFRTDQVSGESHPFAPHPSSLGRRESRDEEHKSEMDSVTIALAVLAFLSVACLIPLYIAVLQARL